MRKITRPVLFAATALALSAPAFAQTAPIRMGQTSTQQAIQQTDAVLARQTTRISELEAQIQTLTGKMENLEFQFGQASRENEDLRKENSALFERLTRLEGKVDGLSSRSVIGQGMNVSRPLPSSQQVPLPGKTNTQTTVKQPGWNTPSPQSGGTTPTDSTPTDLRGGPVTQRTTTRVITSQTSQPNGLGTLPASQLPGDAGALFELGKNRLVAFDHDGAEAAFRAFLEEFGDDPQAGEARYWLGEALFQKGDYTGSAKFFADLLKNYPDDPRRGEAVVKLARSLRESGNTERACTFLSRLDDIAPNVSNSTKQRVAQEKQRSNCD